MPARPCFNESQVNLLNGHGRSREGSDSSSILSSSSNSSGASIRSGSTNYPPVSYCSRSQQIVNEVNTFSPPPVDRPETGRVPLPEYRRQAPPSPPTAPRVPQKPVQHRSQRGSHHRPQCLLRRRTLILLSAFSFTLSITAVTLLAVIFANQSSLSWEDNTFPDGRYEVCIECIKLMQNPDDKDSPLMQQLITKVDKGRPPSCCARTSGQISALVQLMMRYNKNIPVQQSYSSQDAYRFSPVSAHVIFKAPETRTDIQFEKSHTLKIDTRVNYDRKDRTHVREVIVSNNSMTILHTGWYFVYSSVYFRPTPDRKCKEFKYQTWGNFIMRLSQNRPDKSGCLTKTAQTCCDNCETDHQSSYTGGVFSLSQGDSIYVEISGDGLVKYDEEATFMGLVMLGSN
ncbi:unnamed protein product [Lymnaea stagnalis]|uniref:THD domain-containing protein n=1 Tax=Lymnaea stagnalis TaxID=6523 RepID=A0AAV2HE38_LYMST